MVSAGKIGFPEVRGGLKQDDQCRRSILQPYGETICLSPGQIANLEDAWDTVLNDFSKAGEDIFSAGIPGLPTLWNTWTMCYAYSNPLPLPTAQGRCTYQRGDERTHTGVAVLDNTARSAKLVLMKAEAALMALPPLRLGYDRR